MSEQVYPTWLRLDARTHASAEQCDGVPDFLIVRDGAGWRVKWRTSACWGPGYQTIAAAKASVTEGLRPSVPRGRRT